MKKIIYTRPDGGLTVVTPVINTHTVVDGELVPIAEDLSEQEALDRAMAKLPADAIGIQVVDESTIPTDRTFRDAWKAGTGRVEHDMDKAREIQKERLRVLRAPLLVELDVDFMRAIEAGDVLAQQRIGEQKQQLRDATADPAIAAATTPEQLKAAVPEMLA